jgi:ATP-binding cassette, subfamily C, bacterial CydD
MGDGLRSASELSRARPRPIDVRLLREVPGLAGPIACSVALGLISTASVVVQALALATLIASALPGGHLGDHMSALVSLGAAGGIRGLVFLVGEGVAQRGAARTKSELRAAILTASLRSGTPAPEAGAGEMASIAGRGLDALEVYVGRCVPDLLLAVAAPVALVAVVGALDWISGLIIVVVLLLFPIFGVLVGRASTTLASSRWAQLESLGRQVEDIFRGLPVLRAFDRAADQRRRIQQTSEALHRASMDTLRIALLSALVLDTLASVSVALVAVPLGLRLVHGGIHLATALAVLIVTPEVFVPMRRASAGFHDSTEGLAALARVWELVDHRSADGAPGSRADDQMVCDPSVAVALRSVRVEFPDRPEPVLDDATLTIEPGEIVALTGANGAGKTTLLCVLLGFVQPSRGSIAVGAHGAIAPSIERWRREVSYLPEHPTLLGATLAENLRLGAPGTPDDRLLAVLGSVGGAELVTRLPAGLDTRVGEGGWALSAGERQQTALARALLKPASLYLLDEPTVHLSPHAEAVVVAELGRALRGRSALIVTHHPAVLPIADRVVTLRHGHFHPGEPRSIAAALTRAP